MPTPATTPTSTMRLSRISWALLLLASVAHSQSDEEILDLVRANATKIFLEQASWTLPESFHNSGLAASDKERLIEQWANASRACLADALAEYAKSTDVPLSDLVSESGAFSLKGDGAKADFETFLDACIERAWAAAGASLEH